jgi:hypothetical protein
MKSYQGDLYWDRFQKHHGSMMYNTKIAQSIGYQETGDIHSQEDLFLYKGFIELGVKIEWVQEGLLFYRRHRENFIKN